MNKWTAVDQQGVYPVTWNGRSFDICLQGMHAMKDENSVLDVNWEPPYMIVYKVRESGTDEWSVGFELPLMNVKLVDLKPDTEYDYVMRLVTKDGMVDSTYNTFRTNAEGEAFLAGDVN